LAGCGESDDARRARWAQALERWETSHEPSSYAEWSSLPEGTPEALEAERRLREAERHYRAGIALVESGDAGARVEFEEGVRTAPMNPALYLPLARAFRGQAELQPDNPHLFIRAAEYYRKFLALAPRDPRIQEARQELEELDPSSTQFLEPTNTEPSRTAEQESAARLQWATSLTLAALTLALLAIVLIVRNQRRASSLAELTKERPELHPAIAYLIATLRHELLKHRIGAVTSSLTEGAVIEAKQRAFIAERLFTGEPLLQAWENHLASFERGLGNDLDLRRFDPAFRLADKAMRRIAKLETRARKGDSDALARIGEQLVHLRALDRSLAQLVAGLVRTRLDASLARAVFEEVRTEHAAGEVKLDGVAIDAPDPAPYIEVFRVDLVLILKNVIRNALVAVGQSEAPRRIAIEVQVDLLPTGEENVVLRVLDSSPDVLTTEAIHERRVDRGLGLVTAALTRYDGAILVEEAAAPYRKAVCIRFFRAFDRLEA
jgi:tetratricopeptide (TPR) repeat protein